MTTDERAVEILNKCDFFNLFTLDEFLDYSPVGRGVILNGSRERINVINRQIAATIAYLNTRNLNRAGRLVNLDHATVVYSVRAVHNNVMIKDALFYNALKDFKDNFKQCKELEFGISYAVAMMLMENEQKRIEDLNIKKELHKRKGELSLTVSECEQEINQINKQIQNEF